MTSHQSNQNAVTTRPSNKKKWFLGIFLLTIAFITTTGVWLVTTPSGTHWLLSTVSRMSAGSVVFSGINGTISALRTESILFISDDLEFTIQGFELNWQPRKLLSGQFMIHQLSAEAIDVLSPPSEEPSPPLTMPESLQLPFSILINHIKISTLRVFSERTDGTDAPDFSASEFTAHLQSDGQRHRLSDLHIKSDFGALKVSAQLDGVKPFNIKANINLTGPIRLAEIQLPTSSIMANIDGDLTQLNASIVADGQLLKGDGDITLRPFASFPVIALRMSIEDLNPKTFTSDMPAASISLQTDLQENGTNELIGNISILNSNPAALDQDGLPLHEVRTNMTLSTDLLQFEDMSVRVADGGIIAGNLSWQNENAAGLANLTVKRLNPRALDTRLQPARINGSISLDGDTGMQRSIIALKDKTLSLDATLTHTDQAVTLEKLQLRRQHSALTGKGKLNLDDRQSFNIEGKLIEFNLSDFIKAPNSDLNLAFNLAGNLAPQIAVSANFKFEKSKLAAQPVSGGGHIEYQQPDLTKGTIDLKIGSNSLRARGGFGKPGDELLLDITAPKLAQIEPEINGDFNVKANFAGSFSSPKIRFEMKGNNLSLPGNHDLNHISAHGHLFDESISLEINANNYRTENDEQLQQLSIALSGEKSRHQLLVKAQIDDDIVINLQTEGGLIQPLHNKQTVQWSGELSQLSATGPLPINLLSPTKLELSEERIFLDTTKLAVTGGKFNLENTLWTPQQWHTRGEFSSIAIRPGSVTNENEKSLYIGGKWNIVSTTQLEGYLRIAREKGDWIFPGEYPISLGLETLRFNSKVENGELSANLDVQGKNIGTTNVSLSVPLGQQDASWTILPNAPLNGQISSKIKDISWIGPTLDENLISGGNFDMQANLSGTFDNPDINGEISGENLALAMLDQGLRLQHGKLIAYFDQNALHIDTLKFEAPKQEPPKDFLMAEIEVRQNPESEHKIPDEFQMKQEPGTLMVSGKIGLTGNDSKLKIDLNQLPVALETNYWILASGNANILFNEKMLEFEGSVNADAGILTQPPASQPKLADDVIISGQSPQQSDTLQIKIDASLDLGEHFYIQASGLEGRLVGNLRIASTERQTLHATGSINTRNADFDAYGQNLRVKRGIVEFDGSLDDPGLNILAVRENLPVEAGVEVLGTVQRPRIRLVSTPNVPDSEKLSWIVAGRSLESGGVDSSLLLTAAGSILGGQPGGGGITDQLSQALGVDDISFRQSNNTNGGNPLSNQIGTVGKRLSSRAYLSYEQGLTTASAGVTKLTYSLTPRIRIVTQAGVDSALDVFYTFQFD